MHEDVVCWVHSDILVAQSSHGLLLNTGELYFGMV